MASAVRSIGTGSIPDPVFYKDSDGIYRCLALESFNWLAHGFGTRASGDISLSDGLVTLKQIHSAIAIVANGVSGCAGEGDALLSNEPGRMLSIRTADCLPILIVDPKHRVVAAIHAGWRGTVRRIAPKTVCRMAEAFGSKPEDLMVAMGPAIQACCFEVGEEVASQFNDLVPGPFQGRAPSKIDLIDANRTLLTEAGIRHGRIYASSLCTFCHPAEFYSYRRERGTAGRMVSVMGLKPNL